MRNGNDVDVGGVGAGDAAAVDRERQELLDDASRRFWMFLRQVKAESSKTAFAAAVRPMPREAGNGTLANVGSDFIRDALLSMRIAAYGFLVSERETIPPSQTASTELFKDAAIPKTYRPRGSAIAA